MAGKFLEIEPAVGAADEFRSPRFKIVHHVDDVVDPDPGQLGIDQLAAVFEDVLKMQLRAVILTHRGGKAAARYRGRATGGAPFGHLDDINAGLGALERGHGSGGAATDDQDVGLVRLMGTSSRIGLLCFLLFVASEVSDTKNASTQASAKALSLMCSGSSSIDGDFRSRLRESTKILVVARDFPRPLVVAVEIPCAALGMLAEALKWNENAHRTPGRVDPSGEFRAQLPELLGVSAHEQVLRIVLEEFARLVPFGHLAHPKIGMVDRSRHDHLRQAGSAGACHSRSARGIDAIDDEIRKLMRRHVDDAGKLAGGRKLFERFAADA